MPGPEPVVTHDLEDAAVVRNGVQTTIGTRSYHSPFAGDDAWPSVVTREVWCGVLAAWGSVGVAEDVLDPLMGYTAEVLPSLRLWAEAAVEAMEDLGIPGR